MNMKKIILFTALTGMLLTFAVAYAVAAGSIVEKDPGPVADAPGSPNLSSDAPVLQPGLYGTSQTGDAYESPLFNKKGDKDTYKLSVYPGVQFKFKVTPHNGQDIALQLLNANGQTIPAPFHWMNADYLAEWDKKPAGSAEELTYIKSLELSPQEDAVESLYIQVYDKRPAGELPAEYGIERYTIDYVEQNMPDAGWTVDAPKTPLRAAKIEWGQIYEGYLGYLDYQDCFQFDPRPAVGKKVTVTAKPFDPELDVDIQMNRSFYDADGALMSGFAEFGAGEVKIGNTKYTGSNERIKEFHEGGPGSVNSLVAHPYYAKASSGSIHSNFAYVCPELQSGRGRYEFSIRYEDVAGARQPTDEEKRNLSYPPAARQAPEAPAAREKLNKDVSYLGDELGPSNAAETPGEVDQPPAEEPSPVVESSEFIKYRIGAKIPNNLRDKAKERAVYDIFKKIYGRKPKLARRQDRIFIQAAAYKLEPKKASPKKEKVALAKFEKIFGRQPAGVDDATIVKAMAYTRLRPKIKR